MPVLEILPAILRRTPVVSIDRVSFLHQPLQLLGVSQRIIRFELPRFHGSQQSCSDLRILWITRDVIPFMWIDLQIVKLEFGRIEPAGIAGFGAIRRTGQLLVGQASRPMSRPVNTVIPCRWILAVANRRMDQLLSSITNPPQRTAKMRGVEVPIEGHRMTKIITTRSVENCPQRLPWQTRGRCNAGRLHERWQQINR
jgi:hypothetical protein